MTELALQTGVRTLPMVDVVLRILRGAIAARASDVHIKGGGVPTVRIEGQVCPLDHPALPEDVVTSAVLALAAWANLDGAAVERTQFDFSVQIPEIGRFRAHAYRQAGGLALALRHITMPIPDFGALRLPPVVKRIVQADRGLVLVTGATGNGKSTTIASLLNYMNQTESRRVVTIEHPIEWLFTDQHCSFVQREVGRDVASAQEGLEGALRQDPDAIFIGEIRTLEEFEVALGAAESGRLVISTFHATDSTRAIQRMVNLYPLDHRDSVRQRVADALTAIVSQKLLPRRGKRERILATEVLTRTPTIQDCIRDATRTRSIGGALEAGTHEHGTHTFDQQLVSLVRDGLVALDTAKAAANSASDLVRNLSLQR